MVIYSSGSCRIGIYGGSGSEQWFDVREALYAAVSPYIKEDPDNLLLDQNHYSLEGVQVVGEALLKKVKSICSL